MKSCEYDGEPFEEARSHPWTDAVGGPECRYHDLKTEPALIRTALEDFVPFGHYAGVTQLYALLERLNAPCSSLESNDCAFSGPHASEASQPGKSLQCNGRVMILYRELELNLSRRRVVALATSLHLRLVELDKEFEWGMIGTTIVPVRYLALPVAPDRQLGYQLMLSFWAWGDSEAETMDHLERVVVNLAQALGEVFAELRPG